MTQSTARKPPAAGPAGKGGCRARATRACQMSASFGAAGAGCHRPTWLCVPKTHPWVLTVLSACAGAGSKRAWATLAARLRGWALDDAAWL